MAAVIITGSVAAGYVFVIRGTGGGQPPKVLEFLSGGFDVLPPSNHTNQVVVLFFVENVASKAIASLTASISGLPVLQFGAGSTFRGINSSNPLYPNEITHNIPPPGSYSIEYPSNVTFANGTQVSVTFNAVLSDGTESQLTQNFTVQGTSTHFTPREYLPSASCRPFEDGNPFHITTVSYSVGNSSKASWTVAVWADFPLPAAAISVGVNNGTIWFPLSYNGQPVSPANSVPQSTNITQTFTWTLAQGHTVETTFEWVGVCTEENLMTTITVHG
jgi:hypothetical protein